MLSGYMLLDDQEFASHFVSHLLIYIQIANDMKPHPVMISILSTLCKWLPKWKAIKGQDIIEIAFKEAAVREQVHTCIIFNLCHFFFIIKFDYAFLNLFYLILNRLEQINIATKGHLG